MSDYQRQYPEFSACGLNCGLCPRYHTDGSSRCPGCGGEGFFRQRPKCGVISCNRRKGIEFCYRCDEFPCSKIEKADAVDSFITHLNMLSDSRRAQHIGLEGYAAELDQKMAILRLLLDKYNDGRRKSFYCTAVNLLELGDLKDVFAQVERQVDAEGPVKERSAQAAKIFQARADELGISLKLRKK